MSKVSILLSSWLQEDHISHLRPFLTSFHTPTADRWHTQMRVTGKVAKASPHRGVGWVCRNHGGWHSIARASKAGLLPTEGMKGESGTNTGKERHVERAPLRGALAFSCDLRRTSPLYPPPSLQAVARTPRWQTQPEAESREERIEADGGRMLSHPLRKNN